MSNTLRDDGEPQDTSYDTLDMTDTLARYYRAAKKLAKLGLHGEAQAEFGLAKKYLNGDRIQHALFHYNRARMYTQAGEFWSAQQSLVEGLDALDEVAHPDLAEVMRRQYAELEERRVAEADWPAAEIIPLRVIEPWLSLEAADDLIA